MQAMILEEDAALRTEIAAALASAGFDILSFGRLAPAKAALRRAAPDLLVLGESVEGRLSHDVALLAEWRNPGLGAILLSDREGEGMDDLFDLIPSLRFVLRRRTGPRAVAQAALSAIRSRPARPPLPDDGDDCPTDLPPSAEALPQGPGPLPAAGATPTGPVLAQDAAPGTLSPTETRRLLAELGRRYARLVEDSAPVPSGVASQAAAMAPPMAFPPRRPARPALPPGTEPTPPARPVPPKSLTPAARRLHLA